MPFRAASRRRDSCASSATTSFPPSRQHQVRDAGRLVGIVDYAFPGAKIAIEVDSYRWHSGRASWQKDLTRRIEFTRLGWAVLHITPEDIVRRARATAESLRRALVDRSAANS